MKRLRRPSPGRKGGKEVASVGKSENKSLDIPARIQGCSLDIAALLVGVKDVPKAKALQVEGWTLSPSLWKLSKTGQGG